MNYQNMLESIWSGQWSGFVVIQDLELCHAAGSPNMGFCIQCTGTKPKIMIFFDTPYILQIAYCQTPVMEDWYQCD